MSVPMATLPKFDTTLGPLLLGGMFAMSLWGVTCVQTYMYFNRPRRDHASFRAIIAFLLALDTFDTVLNVHLVYHYLVSNYMNFPALLIPTWSILIHVAATALSNFIIRALFVQRIYYLSSKSLAITSGIMVISSLDLGTGIYITVKAFQMDSFLQLDTLSTPMYVTFAAGTGADLAVALALCYFLQGARTGFKNTDGVIKILLRYTINTGLIVAIDATAGMILYIVMPHNFIFLGPYLLLSKLYLNSYLATMNARQHVRDQMDSHVSIHLSEIPDFSMQFAPVDPDFSDKPSDSESGRIAVSVNTLVDGHMEKTRSHVNKPSDDSVQMGRAF